MSYSYTLAFQATSNKLRLTQFGSICNYAIRILDSYSDIGVHTYKRFLREKQIVQKIVNLIYSFGLNILYTVYM